MAGSVDAHTNQGMMIRIDGMNMWEKEAAEDAVKCAKELIKHGWRYNIEDDNWTGIHGTINYITVRQPEELWYVMPELQDGRIHLGGDGTAPPSLTIMDGDVVVAFFAPDSWIDAWGVCTTKLSKGC
jgi:hypothetical protein